MSEEENFTLDESTRQQSEAMLVSLRIAELHAEPIKGNFDANHLKAVHAYIFQDLPEHQPGVVRRDEPEWTKTRILESVNVPYVVSYEHQGIEGKITSILDQFGGADAIRGLPPEIAAGHLAKLYGDLDRAHGFYEGNSRTLREFTRELASSSGFQLNWTGTGVTTKERNQLYIARDLAVLERTYPNLTEDRAMITENRAEYEAFFVIQALRKASGERSLQAIIADGLSAETGLNRGETTHMDETDQTVEQQTSAPTQSNVASTNAALETAGDIAEGVSAVAEGVIESHASSMESLLGGGTPQPAPTEEPVIGFAAPRREVTVEESIAEGQQQHAEALRDFAKGMEQSADLQQDVSLERDRSGGISR